MILRAQQFRNARRYSSGVTLIELVIVVTILALLVMVAFPNYRDVSARAKRNEAKATLLQIAAQQERWYLNNNSYTLDMTNLGFDVGAGYITPSETYTVSVTDAGPNNFRAVATYRPTDAEAGRCRTFELDARGERISSPETDCWTRSR